MPGANKCHFRPCGASRFNQRRTLDAWQKGMPSPLMSFIRNGIGDNQHKIRAIRAGIEAAASTANSHTASAKTIRRATAASFSPLSMPVATPRQFENRPSYSKPEMMEFRI
jgi:hypothetical protein